MASLNDVTLTTYLPPTEIAPYFKAKGVMTRCHNAIEKYFEDCIDTGASHKEILDKCNKEIGVCVEPFEREMESDAGARAVVTTCAVICAGGAIYGVAADIYDRVSGKK